MLSAVFDDGDAVCNWGEEISLHEWSRLFAG